MSLFVRLSTVAVVAVLLRCVPATVNITAPSKVIDNTAGLETREQGPTAWICTALAVESPWISYANIRGYLEGGNAEKRDYSNFGLYPVMEIFHASESRLCVYLPAEDHCYPPAPITNQVKAVKQLTKRNYYAIRFWGQASNARVQYYKEKLTAALNTQSKAAKFDLFFVSYFSDHVREARFDSAPTAAVGSVVPLVESGSLTSPATLIYTMSGSPVQAAGQEYHRATIPVSRLSFSDVRTMNMNSASMDSCAAAASIEDRNAFSFVNNVCTLYTFGEDFCQYTPGEFEIYINKKLLGVTKDLGQNRVADSDLKEMVIYPEVSWTAGPFQSMIMSKSSTEGDLADCQVELRELRASQSIYAAALVLDNYCYLTQLIDVANCTQPCRGDQQPVQAIVMKAQPTIDIGPPFLSLCGKNVSIPMPDGTDVSSVYIFSHAGFGCYPYPEAKRAEDEDCLVIFETVVEVEMVIQYVDLVGEQDACHDFISLHEGKNPDMAKDVTRHCKGNPWMRLAGALTVNFHRKQGTQGVRKGFKLKFQIYA